MDTKTFTIGVEVRGNLVSAYCFENETQYNQWVKKDFPLLEKKHGKLLMSKFSLPGFKVGDTCCVYGEGWDTFVIEGVKLYSPNRYGFILDSGYCEEVVKCWKREEDY